MRHPRGPCPSVWEQLNLLHQERRTDAALTAIKSCRKCSKIFHSQHHDYFNKRQRQPVLRPQSHTRPHSFAHLCTSHVTNSSTLCCGSEAQPWVTSWPPSPHWFPILVHDPPFISRHRCELAMVLILLLLLLTVTSFLNVTGRFYYQEEKEKNHITFWLLQSITGTASKETSGPTILSSVNKLKLFLEQLLETIFSGNNSLCWICINHKLIFDHPPFVTVDDYQSDRTKTNCAR